MQPTGAFKFFIKPTNERILDDSINFIKNVLPEKYSKRITKSFVDRLRTSIKQLSEDDILQFKQQTDSTETDLFLLKKQYAVYQLTTKALSNLEISPEYRQFLQLIASKLSNSLACKDHGTAKFVAYLHKVYLSRNKPLASDVLKVHGFKNLFNLPSNEGEDYSSVIFNLAKRIDTQDSNLILELESPIFDSSIHSVTFDERGHGFARICLNKSGNFGLLDLTTGEFVKVNNATIIDCSLPTFGPDGQAITFVTVSKKDDVSGESKEVNCYFDIKTGELIGENLNLHSGDVPVFGPNGQIVAPVSIQDQVQPTKGFLDLKNLTLSGIELNIKDCLQLIFNLEGQALAIISTDTIYSQSVFNVTSNTLINTPKLFSPTGQKPRFIFNDAGDVILVLNQNTKDGRYWNLKLEKFESSESDFSSSEFALPKFSNRNHHVISEHDYYHRMIKSRIEIFQDANGNNFKFTRNDKGELCVLNVDSGSIKKVKGDVDLFKTEEEYYDYVNTFVAKDNNTFLVASDCSDDYVFLFNLNTSTIKYIEVNITQRAIFLANTVSGGSYMLILDSIENGLIRLFDVQKSMYVQSIQSKRFDYLDPYIRSSFFKLYYSCDNEVLLNVIMEGGRPYVIDLDRLANADPVIHAINYISPKPINPYNKSGGPYG